MERPESNSSRPSGFGKVLVSSSAVVLLLGSLAAAQTASPGLTSLPSPEQVIQRVQDPYLGSIPQGKATNEVVELSISDALDRALKYNLGLYLSDRATDQTRAARLRALSALMPVVNGGFSESDNKINLRAFGFTFPGFPSSVGPFGLTELQATGSWNPLNLHSLNNLRAAKEDVKASSFSYRNARDTVVLAVGANYLLTIANESRVQSAEAELKAAQALYQLAVDQENAGISPNIDTLRARVQLQTQQSLLIQAQNDLEKQRIALARVIGLPVQQKFSLVNRVPYQPLPEAATENAVERALQTRPDYQAALAALKAAQYSETSAWQQRLPSIGFSGNYGVLGFTPSQMSPAWTATATLSIPIYQGGRVEADVQQARAVLKERQAQVDNLKGSIEQEIEDALLDLKAAAKQVEVARVGLDFAEQTLQQSQDRFAAGVTNNVEVIQAQQQLASANEQYIGSLYAHNIAKVLLARAIGNAEDAVKQYLSQPGNVVPSAPGTPAAPGTAAPDNTTPGAPGTVTPAPAAPPSSSPSPSGVTGSLQPVGPVTRSLSAITKPSSSSTQGVASSKTAGIHNQ